jgi:hypothetical protein
VLRAALAALPGAATGCLAPPREAAAGEALMAQLQTAGFASALPGEFMSRHFMDFGTPKLGTAAPPR